MNDKGGEEGQDQVVDTEYCRFLLFPFPLALKKTPKVLSQAPEPTDKSPKWGFKRHKSLLARLSDKFRYGVRDEERWRHEDSW